MKHKLSISILVLAIISLGLKANEDVNYKQNPLNEDNKLVAQFATKAASQTLSYAKSVNRIDDKFIVDVVVANQICQVDLVN